MLIDSLEELSDEPPKTIEVVKAAWTCYIPTALLGTFSIVCIIGAQAVNSKRMAALAGLYAISETTLRTYSSKVAEIVGQKKEQSIRDAVAKDRVENNPPVDGQVIITGNGEVLCLEALSGRYFKSDMEKIRRAMNDLNADLFSGEDISVNDLNYALGLPNTKLGDEIGWKAEFGKIEFDFSTQLSPDNVPCIVISQKNMPNMGWA